MIIAGIANIEWYVNYQQIKSKASIPPNSVYIYIYKWFNRHQSSILRHIRYFNMSNYVYLYIQYWIFKEYIKILVWVIIYTQMHVCQSYIFGNIQYVDMSNYVYTIIYCTSKHMYMNVDTTISCLDNTCIYSN